MTASALREQLQLALGTAYTLEHELGGGGMSRVFVATEVALGRRVVVKVLPEEMVGPSLAGALQARDRAGRAAPAPAHRAVAHRRDTASARIELNAAILRSAREYVREDVIAIVYFLLGEVERSVQWWERAVDSNGGRVLFLLHKRQFEPLRRDPRAQDVIRRARRARGRDVCQ